MSKARSASLWASSTKAPLPLQTSDSVAGPGRSLPYVLPFILFLALLAVQDYIPIPKTAEYALRLTIMSAVLWIVSRNVIDLRVRRPLFTVLLGIGVFVLWVGPDQLFPGYRTHWLFSNSLTGSGAKPLSADEASNPWLLLLRSARAVLIVPIVEELFWRAWLMRWLIKTDFWEIPLGTYAANAFWITAALFASEHGQYWDVGLACGAIYGWWMVRTKSLGDLILTHAVTNGCLCAYVVATHKWEYWL